MKTLWAVVLLDDPRYGGGPGTIVRLSFKSAGEVLAEFEDQDGCRSDRIRLWLAPARAWEGQRVSL